MRTRTRRSGGAARWPLLTLAACSLVGLSLLYARLEQRRERLHKPRARLESRLSFLSPHRACLLGLGGSVSRLPSRLLGLPLCWREGSPKLFIEEECFYSILKIVFKTFNVFLGQFGMVFIFVHLELSSGNLP